MGADRNADAGHERLNQLLLQHDDRLAAGETTPTLEEYIRLHPDLAGELRAYFQEDSQLKKKTVLLRGNSAPAAATVTATNCPSARSANTRFCAPKLWAAWAWWCGPSIWW